MPPKEKITDNFVSSLDLAGNYASQITPPGAVKLSEPFEFLLTMRIYMEAVNPEGGKRFGVANDADGRQVKTIRWDGASWLHFTTAYAQEAEQVWDGAFKLIPPGNFDGFVWPGDWLHGKRRNLLCRFKIEILPVPHRAHMTVKVVRLATTQFVFRNDAYFSSSNLIDARRGRWNPNHASFGRNDPAHEVGHLLGLGHVNMNDPKCQTSSEGICYGSNLVQVMQVMGAGDMLELKNAAPWLNRIHHHTVPDTRTADWKADWAESWIESRGMEELEYDGPKREPVYTPPPRPGMIDL